jgi:hypothetical protein
VELEIVMSIDCHKFFCGLVSATHPCWSFNEQKWWVDVQLGGGPREKVIFRNIKDISSALIKSKNMRQRYLLPSITNLALIDSIIPPSVVLQMTISNNHSGASSKVNDIYNQLNRPPRLVMVFVVREEVVEKFHFPTHLPSYVTMYVTVAKPMTLAEAQKKK